MTTLQEQRATLARGRRLIRISVWLLGVALALSLVGLGALLLAWWAGRLDDNDATPAVIGIIPITAVIIAFVALSFAGRRLVRRSIDDVAANPDQQVPEALRVGPARWWLPSTSAAALIGLAIAALVFLPVSPSTLLCPGLMAAISLVQFVSLGPSAQGIYSASIDSSGIQLPELGIQVPWTSINHVKINRSGVRIGIDGPVMSSARFPAVWARRIARGLNRKGSVDLSTDRQDEVMWIAQRYRTSKVEG